MRSVQVVCLDALSRMLIRFDTNVNMLIQVQLPLLLFMRNLISRWLIISDWATGVSYTGDVALCGGLPALQLMASSEIIVC